MVYEVISCRGGLSDYEDKGTQGSFKMGSNLDIRKVMDSISCGQALKELGITTQSASASQSPSASVSPSASGSPSPSPSVSPSSSASPSSAHTSASISPSASKSPSASSSPSSSVSPSSSTSPSPSPSAGLKSVFSDLIRFWVKCSDGNTYGFGNIGKIYKIDANLVCTQVYDAHQQIKGAFEKPSSNGKIYLLFALNSELHRKEIPGNSSWNDVNAPGSIQGDTWPKTNLTSADWHTMANVGGDILIGNSSSLAMAAYDDSYTNDALDLIPGNIVKTVLERNGRAVIGTYKAADPNHGINAAIDAEVPLSQVGNDGQIFFANFTDSIPAKRFPGGGKVNPGGVANQVDQVLFFEWEQNALSWITKQAVGNMALFGVYGADSGKGGVYTYGRLNKNHPFVLNLEYLLDADEIGAVTHVNGVTLVSYRIGSTFGVRATDLTTKAKATYDALDFRSPVLLFRHRFKRPIDIAQFDLVELLMAPLPTGASVEFWYQLNKTGSFIQAKTADGNSTFTTANAQKAVFRLGAEGQIFDYRIVCNPIGNLTPEIYRTLVYFQ